MSERLDAFRALKERVKVKGYGAEPEGAIRVGPYIFTYCIEKLGFIEQATLAVSAIDGFCFAQDNELHADIQAVFGLWIMLSSRNFPKRGYTQMMVFK